MQEAQPAPPTPPTPPAPPQIVIDGAGGVAIPTQVVGGTASPSEILQAFQAQRDELRNQLESIKGERYDIARRLRQGEVSGVDKAGLESRMQQLDARILEQSKAVAAADARVASQKGVPGAYIPPFRDRGGPPKEAMEMAFVLALVLLVPTSLAIARRIWRRGSRYSAPVGMSPEFDERLTRLEQAMDAVAVEVERVGEGQRYVTRMLGAGSAQPLSQRVAEQLGERVGGRAGERSGERAGARVEVPR